MNSVRVGSNINELVTDFTETSDIAFVEVCINLVLHSLVEVVDDRSGTSSIIVIDTEKIVSEIIEFL